MMPSSPAEGSQLPTQSTRLFGALTGLAGLPALVAAGLVLPAFFVIRFIMGMLSAPVYPGDSGGALVDLSGRVVGMPTLSSSGGRRASAAPSVAFAIPSSSIVRVANQLIASGKVSHTGSAYLGVTLQDDPNGGARVQSVVSGSPADKAGLKPQSVITAIGDRAVADVDGLSQVLAALKPGDTVSLHVVKPDGSSTTVSVTLGELTAS